jgi:hypothetical protein
MNLSQSLDRTPTQAVLNPLSRIAAAALLGAALAVAAALASGSASANGAPETHSRVPLSADNPIASTTRVVFRILFVPTASVLSTGFTSATTTAAAGEQKALALAALEDAAHFVDSGELRGVLPMVMERLRELDPEAETTSNSELVDAIVESAEQALEQVEAYYRTSHQADR